jgi:hypothetical protein
MAAVMALYDDVLGRRAPGLAAASAIRLRAA